ncbi:MAG: STAS domain-containing protein [Treponema sp.]|nr:STAS domain-containing protein [Treponema sp.]
MKILKNESNIFIIQVQGNMDLFSSNLLKEQVMKMIEQKIERFIIDLKETVTINSAGIGALINISSTAQKLNFHFILVNVNDEIREALEINKLSAYIPIAATLKEAVKLVES